MGVREPPLPRTNAMFTIWGDLELKLAGMFFLR